MYTTPTVKPGSTSWIMVETLDPTQEPTVVSSGDIGREFQALDRVVHRIINAAKMGHVIDADDVIRRILAARDQGEPVDTLYGQGNYKYLLRVLPVFGPQRRVHGVQFWFGPIADDPPEPRQAAGIVWDLPAKLVHLTIDCTRMAGIPDVKFLPELPLAMFWRNASRFDHHEAVFNLLYHPDESARLQTTGTVRHASRRNMLWQTTIRTRYDSDTIGAWGLLEDLTSETSQPPEMTLELEGCHEYLRSSGTYLGVVHIPDGTIVQWLSEPPPWIDCTRAPDQLFPPEDHARLMGAVAPDEGVVRVLNHDSGYTPTRIVLSPYRSCRNNRLAIGQFLRVEGSPTSDCERDHRRPVRHRDRIAGNPSITGDVDRATPHVPEPRSTGREHHYTLAEVPKILRVSRTTVFELLASGALASIRIGSRRFVTDSQVDDYLANLKNQSSN